MKHLLLAAIVVLVLLLGAASPVEARPICEYQPIDRVVHFLVSENPDDSPATILYRGQVVAAGVHAHVAERAFREGRYCAPRCRCEGLAALPRGLPVTIGIGYQ